jgi:hypothetical protein
MWIEKIPKGRANSGFLSELSLDHLKSEQGNYSEQSI